MGDNKTQGGGAKRRPLGAAPKAPLCCLRFGKHTRRFTGTGLGGQVFDRKLATYRSGPQYQGPLRFRTETGKSETWQLPKQENRKTSQKTGSGFEKGFLRRCDRKNRRFNRPNRSGLGPDFDQKGAKRPPPSPCGFNVFVLFSFVFLLHL